MSRYVLLYHWLIFFVSLWCVVVKHSTALTNRNGALLFSAVLNSRYRRLDVAFNGDKNVGKRIDRATAYRQDI